MANQLHLDLLSRGVQVWNRWRQNHPNIQPDFTLASLQGTDLRGANLRGANFQYASLRGANLRGANLCEANFCAQRGIVDIFDDKLLNRKEEVRMKLNGLDLDLLLSRSSSYDDREQGTDLSEADLSEANLKRANLTWSNLSRATLRDTDLYGAILHTANLDEADLTGAGLVRADISKASLVRANLRGAILYEADLHEAILYKADLRETDLRRTDLIWGKLYKADLRGADLRNSLLVGADLREANLTGCFIYGISAWDIRSEGAIQSNLIITQRSSAQSITVDNLKVAQFIHLLLNNQEIRDVINTIGKKGVLILGRFSQERKQVLDALQEKLRSLNFLPIIFDFECPTERDFTETVKTLAGLCCFIIADITNPKSSPLELQATVPDYMIPFVPLIQEGEQPFSMFRDIQMKYDWVLDVLVYDTPSHLISGLEEAVVKPALKKRAELLPKKVEQVRTRHIEDYLV